MSVAAFVRCQNRSEAMKEKEEKIGNIGFCLITVTPYVSTPICLFLKSLSRDVKHSKLKIHVDAFIGSKLSLRLKVLR